MSRAFIFALITIAVMLTAIVFIVWGIVVLYGGPANALLYIFVFGDTGAFVMVIEIARRKRNKPVASNNAGST